MRCGPNESRYLAAWSRMVNARPRAWGRMGFKIWDTPSGRKRRWGKRRNAITPAPTYARVAVIVLATALLGTLAWQGIQRLLHPPDTARVAATSAPANGMDAHSAVSAWQSGVSAALEAATLQGTSGNITAAEVEVDRMVAILVSARMQSQAVTPDFFQSSLAALDRVLQTHPDNQRLFEHITLARIELAQLRSAQIPIPGTSDSTQSRAAGDEPASGLRDPTDPAVTVGPGTRAPHSESIPGRVVFASPRALDVRALLDPATLKGNSIDATLMPETSEILLPPSARHLADDVRVEGLTIQGASQTLDGIRWKNVTFIGTRLRYEGGEVALQNVSFIRCTFGFSTDERGARLASAVALGQRNFVVE
jgi:hypothetical protein